MVRRFDQVGEHEPGGELAADLPGQRVAVPDQAAVSAGPGAFAGGQVERAERER